MTEDLSKYRDWIGRKRTADDIVTLWPVKAMTATLDAPDPEPKAGDPVPPMWHWMYFLEAAPASKIGPDGHPERGDFLPPLPLPRRMYAGSKLTIERPIHIGETVRRESEIVGVEPKAGATGTMCFVTIRHSVFGEKGFAFSDEQGAVYREEAKPGEQQTKPRPAPTDATWTKTITPDPVMLFRYSALTFNGHRIHYDHPYVTGVEGYPGMLVHGPLMGMLMSELARRSVPGRTLKAFEFRAMSPMYHTRPFTVNARREPDGSLTTWVANADGGLAQQGKATFG
jgi:3-methylfumaryl-CoA hydratase